MLGLHRDDQLLAGRQRVDHQHTQNRRAVDDRVVIVLPQLRQAAGNHKAQAALPRSLTLEGRQGRGGRQQGNFLVAGGQQQLRGQALRHLALMQKQVVDTVFQTIGVITEVAGHGAVRVKIDHHHALARLCQQTGQGDGCGGLADPTFLIGYCPDSHSVVPPGCMRAGRDL